MLIISLLVLVLTLIAVVFNWARKSNLFWEKRKIKHLKPHLLFGNSLPVILNQKNTCEIFEELCEKYPNEPLLGYYDFTNKWLIVQDAELVERILIKDFMHFTDHGFEIFEEKNPIDAQLFTMTGNRWRAFRYKLSPIFTSGKLKSMFQAMSGCGDNLVNHLSSTKKYKEIVLREVMTSFSMDVVASTVFGIKPNVLDNPDSEFRKMGKKVFMSGTFVFLKVFIIMTFPWIAKILGLSFNDKSVVDYFTNIIKNTISYRKNNNIQRNDFVQMMLQLQEKGHIEIQNWDSNDDYLKSDEPVNATMDSYEITENILIGQAFTFLTTGLDTIGIAQMYLLFELSQHLDIQQKVREEILEQVKIHGGFNYDSLKAMLYLEKAVKESLRLRATPQLFRICTKDYVFPNGYIIKKGELLQIPVTVIHKNPDYHPEPGVFKPERFDSPMKPATWLPFGEGPRVCIAMRYAILQVKFGIARVLMKYRLRLNSKTTLPIKIQPQSILMEPQQPIYFDLEEI